MGGISPGQNIPKQSASNRATMPNDIQFHLINDQIVEKTKRQRTDNPQLAGLILSLVKYANILSYGIIRMSFYANYRLLCGW